jgi:hypothetical protein
MLLPYNSSCLTLLLLFLLLDVVVAIVFALARQLGTFYVFFFGGFPYLGTLVAS